MNTQSANQKDVQQNVELRIRTMRTLWIAMFLSVGGYYVFTFFVGRPEDIKANGMLFLVLFGMALSTTLISFPLKNKLVSRAVEQQQPQLVQQAYVLAWALTEVAALLGVLDFFLTGSQYYFILFIIAACGMLLHFPRREDVVNAWSKRSIL